MADASSGSNANMFGDVGHKRVVCPHQTDHAQNNSGTMAGGRGRRWWAELLGSSDSTRCECGT